MLDFLPPKKNLALLDCATGTADQLITLLNHAKHIQKAVGIDLSEQMLSIARTKVDKRAFSLPVDLINASALAIPFANNSFDCVTLSFGIRNVTDVDVCLREILRVLKPGGRAMILETSVPKNKLIRNSHFFYLRKILPVIGGLISRKKHAYTYLNKTAESFPHGKEFCGRILQAGFEQTECHPMTLGVVSLYIADKSL